MHKQLAIKSAIKQNGENNRVIQSKTAKIIVTLLTIAIILTMCVSVGQTFLPLKVSEETLVNVLPANVVWAKSYGGASDDRAFSALPVNDGYLLVGSSRSIVANTTAGWAIKIDDVGNMIWNRTFLEGFGSELRCAVDLADGFLLVGNQFFASGEVSGYIIKIDFQGNPQWQTTVGVGGVNKLFSGIATPDGFAVYGLTEPEGGYQSAAWIVKLNTKGNVVWNKTYGQPNETALRTGVLAQDGDYVVAGYTDLPTAANYNFYLLKIHPDGGIVWNKTYGGEQSEKAYSMTKTSDGYVLVGEVELPTTSTDALVLKVDVNGNKLWDKIVGGKEADSPAYVTQAKDSGYLVSGFTFSFGQGQRDFWLFKISDQGQLLFSCTQGDAGYQESYCVIEKTNSYVMVGWTDPLGQPDLIGKRLYNFYVTEIKVKNAGGIFGFQFMDYAIIVIPVLLVTLVLVSKLRSKGKN